MTTLNEKKLVILIGPVSDDPAESVSCVNKAFVVGLQEHFTFVTSECSRCHGNTRLSRLNLWNLYYLCKHLLIWALNLLRHQPDIAHYAVSSGVAMEKGFILLALARWSGARTVGHLHSGGFLDHWRQLSPARRHLAIRQLAKLDAFIVLSEKWRDHIVRETGIDRNRIHVVNNPISLAFEAEALSLPIERSEIRMLSLGTLGKDKGVIELVTASAAVVREIPGFQLDLVGPERDPGIRQQVECQLEELGISRHVHLLGTVQGEPKMKLFREASIFVLPSYYENFPLVVLEAAASGLAIITTPVGAVPEFFEDGISALFVEPHNPLQLAEAMKRLLENPEERHRFGVAARELFLSRLAHQPILEALASAYAAVRGVSVGGGDPLDRGGAEHTKI